MPAPMITPGQVADLHEHLRTCHGQVHISAEEATDPSFLLALHRVARDQNPGEDGPACAPYTHRASPASCTCCREFGRAHNGYPCSACGHTAA